MRCYDWSRGGCAGHQRRKESNGVRKHIREVIEMVIAPDRAPAAKARRTPNLEWRLDIVKTASEGRLVMDAIITAMAAVRYSKHDQFAVELALEEAITNALRHGNRSDPNKRVTVLVHIDEDQVVAEVEDEGLGFDPSSVSDPRLPSNLDRPGGRGLLLMYRYMSWVRFNQRGNPVTLCRYRSV
jgi:serine/threonine-protein kinase RsbW